MLAYVHNLEGVRVAELGSDAPFPDEAPRQLRVVGQVLVEQLDGDAFAEERVARFEDRSRPPLADEAHDLVTGPGGHR